MKKHTLKYLSHFNYSLEDYMPCEVCGNRAIDVHHIEARGMGGTSQKDEIEGLMGLCRECHIHFGDKKQYIDYLKETHQSFIDNYAKKY
jgi:hypothetical protein